MDATDTAGGAEPIDPHASAGSSSPHVAGVWTAGRQPPGWVATTGVVGVALVIVAGLAIQVVRLVVFTPELAVTDYFDALTAKDPTSLPGGRVDLVASGDYTPPSDMRIEHVTTATGSAAVTVSYTILGQRFTTVVPAQRNQWWGPWTTGGITATLNMTWPQGASDLHATAGGAVVHENSMLHIGSYTVTGSGSDVYTVEQVTVGVTGQVPEIPVTMPVAVHPDLTPRLTTLIHRYLDDCVEGADTLVVTGCPLRYSGAGLPWPEDITWNVDAYPQVNVVIGDLFPLEAATTAPGAATVTYTQGDDEKTQHIALDIDGEVSVTDGVLAWHPDNLTTITE